MVSSVAIGTRQVGPGQPCFIIAEAGVNHNGELALARRLVEAAAEAQADAVKFQTFCAERFVSPCASKAEYQSRATGAHESQLEMLRRLELSADAHRELSGYARSRGVMFLSSPFDEESADLLASLDAPAFKVASGELTNLPLLRHVARYGKPLIVSTGMSSLGEVETALHTIWDTGNRQVILLHCVSRYPADSSEVNLRAMGTMRDAFGVPVGFSDHTLGMEVALAAVALGACVIEKHLTLDRALAGPDHQSSVEPAEMRALVRGIRRVEAALGHGRKEPAASEANTAAVARRSLVAARDIPAGSTLTEQCVALKRPGTGLPSAMLTQLLGRRAQQDIPVGTLLMREMFG